MTQPPLIHPRAKSDYGKLLMWPVMGSHLTGKQMEVLRLICFGLANKQMAERLKISIKTVEKHRQGIYDVLHVNTALALVRVALRVGLMGWEEFLGASEGENISNRGFVMSGHNGRPALPPAGAMG